MPQEDLKQRYKKSLEYIERAERVTPGGAQTLSKRPTRFPFGAYPVALQSGDGAHVVDIDGHRYLDMICGLACMTLGYGFTPKRLAFTVMEAVRIQVLYGVAFSLAHPLEAEVAEKICALIRVPSRCGL